MGSFRYQLLIFYEPYLKLELHLSQDLSGEVVPYKFPANDDSEIELIDLKVTYC